MLVTWLGHAQLFINAADRAVLLDPWFVEPVFAGAWYRYPPPPYPDASSMPRPDFVALSHAHPDHASALTLERLSAESTIVATPFPSDELKRRLDASHLKKVEWVEAWKTHELAPGLKITFVPSDRGWEVSAIVIEADGVRLFHGNDQVLSVAAYANVVERLGKIDIAFLPFAGASSYPTGFSGDSKTLARRCAEKKAEGLSRFLDGLEGLKPAEAAPFASSWALLEPGELWKNFVDRATPVEALKAALPRAHELGIHLLHLEPGDQWSAETGAIAKELTKGWEYDAESIGRYAKQEAARVTAAIRVARPSAKALSAQSLDAAFRAHFTAVLENAPASTRSLSARVGFEAIGLGAWRIEFVPGAAATLSAGLTGDEDDVLALSPDELMSVLTGTTRWEDVWYGYRLQVRTREGTPYAPAFWEMLLSLQVKVDPT